MHHDSIHAVGHGEGLEVALDGDWQWKLVDEMHWCAGDNGTAAEVLQAENWGRRGQMIEGRGSEALDGETLKNAQPSHHQIRDY
jgi:hypothetical protein